MTRTALALVVAMAASAVAADRPVSGAKLLLKRSRAGSEKLVFISKDAAALFPAIGSADDPGTGTPGGALVELFSPAEPAGAALAVPAAGWTAKPGATSAHRFTNKAAPGGVSSVRTIVLKQGRLVKIVGRATGLALTAQQGSVGIRVTTGSLRNCARFGPPSVRRDAPDVFDARNALAAGLADCSNTSLGGAAERCGDGRINQASEECDGSQLGTCAGPFGFSCRPPGVSGECECCSDGGPNMRIVGCCNPSSIIIPAPDLAGTCVATRCDPPFSCTGNDVCQPDGSCCSPLGATCLLTVFPQPLALNACCGVAECRGPGNFGLACCLPDATSCSADADCCTGHCTTGSCESCRAGGAACANPFECCSLSCTSGTCDACAATESSCISGTTCCSGSCNAFTCS